MLKNHMSTCKKTHVNMQHLFLMGNLDCRGFPRGWLFFPGSLADKGLRGSPYSQHGIL